MLSREQKTPNRGNLNLQGIKLINCADEKTERMEPHLWLPQNGSEADAKCPAALYLFLKLPASFKYF